MKKRLSPQEKKERSYEKDHRTRTGECDRSMRRLWAKRKARVNRKYRRKTDAALRKALSPERIDALLAGDDATSRELIRKGLTRENNSRKWGVTSLRNEVDRKLESRMTPRETNRQRRERLAQLFIQDIVAFESDPSGEASAEFVRSLQAGDGRLWDFLRDRPEWKQRLEAKINQLRKEEQKRVQQANMKRDEKRQWRSPTARRRKETE